MFSIRLLEGVCPSSDSLCLSVSAISRAACLWIDQYIPRANSEYWACTLPTAVQKGGDERCANSTVFWDILFETSLQRVFQVWRDREPSQVEVLILNKQFESLCCLFSPSLPPHFIWSQRVEVVFMWHWKITNLRGRALKKRATSFLRKKSRWWRGFFFDRASGHNVFSIAASAHSQHRHAHGGKDVCHALIGNPSWACQLSAPYRLQRLWIRKMREKVRGPGRDEETERWKHKSKDSDWRVWTEKKKGIKSCEKSPESCKSK